MAKNHIYLLWSFIDELKDIMMAEMWIVLARAESPTNQHLQLMLDRKQAEMDARKNEIHNEMFEISRSN